MPLPPTTDARTKSATLWTFGVVLALLIYGSLYPWRFHARPLFGAIIALAQTLPIPPTRMLTKDAILNLFAYIPVGVIAYFAFARSVLTATVLGAALSLLIELIQYFDSWRVTSTMDVCSNTFGTFIGAWLAAHLLIRWKWPLAPTFLLTCFTAWQILAFTALKRAQTPSTMPAEWLVAAWTCVALTGRRAPVAVRWILALIATAVVFWAELWPFQYVAAATPFSWTPFAAFFWGDPGVGFLTMLNKLFLYGSAVWLWREAIGNRFAAGVLVAGILFALERVQMHLPPRTPEITDSIIALVLTMTVMGFEDRVKTPPRS